MIDFNRLAGPFEPSKISWRIGSVSEKDGKSRGMALAYIDARDVMERLDDVVGPGGWQNDYPHAGAKTVCRIGILINDTWVWKSDGAGDTDVEAEKGSLSDAFKRAAVRWGIGRYLYEIAAPWVELEGTGKFKKIASHEHAKLERLLKNYRPAQRPAPDLRNVHDLHTNGKPIQRNASQETAGRMLTKLWTICGDAVATWLARDDVKRAIASLDEVDRHRVEDLAEERSMVRGEAAAQ